MIATDDPRAAELLRRRADRNGPTATTTPAAPAPVPAADLAPRKISACEREEINRLAARNPKWTASDLADAFEGEHGWRPSYQAIGRALAEPAPRAKGGRPRKASAERTRRAPDPAAEVEAIAAVSRALAPLAPAEVRRVLDWARARFDAGDGEGGDS